MDNSKKKCKIIMLDTQGKSILYKRQHNALGRYLKEAESSIPYFNNQHLYILSDESIKEGDWFINTTKNTVNKCNHVDQNIQSGFNHGEYHGKFECKKIIATTDELTAKVINTALGVTQILPQPSQQFIEKYITEYNKGNVIEDVMVEYENIVAENPNIEYDYQGVKVNPRDNTITISRVKDSWNREELIKLMRFARNSGDAEMMDNPDYLEENEYNEWIKENL